MPPTTTIYLVRHGEPSCPHRPALRTREWSQWLASYDAAGISESSRPSELLLTQARDCGKVWTSDLKRSIHSAEILGRPFESSPTFREHDQAPLGLPLLALSSKGWDLVGKTAWIVGYAPGIESFRSARRRAAHAAQTLRRDAESFGSVMLLGHGFFNLLIARQLKRLGFTTRESANFSYWGSRKFIG